MQVKIKAVEAEAAVAVVQRTQVVAAMVVAAATLVVAEVVADISAA
jgi:hypothetical protein